MTIAVELGIIDYECDLTLGRFTLPLPLAVRINLVP